MALHFEPNNYSNNVFDALQCVAHLITEVEDAKRLSSRQIGNLFSELICKENELQASKLDFHNQLTSARDELLSEREQQGKLHDDLKQQLSAQLEALQRLQHLARPLASSHL